MFAVNRPELRLLHRRRNQTLNAIRREFGIDERTLVAQSRNSEDPSVRISRNNTWLSGVVVKSGKVFSASKLIRRSRAPPSSIREEIDRLKHSFNSLDSWSCFAGTIRNRAFTRSANSDVSS